MDVVACGHEKRLLTMVGIQLMHQFHIYWHKKRLVYNFVRCSKYHMMSTYH